MAVATSHSFKKWENSPTASERPWLDSDREFQNLIFGRKSADSSCWKMAMLDLAICLLTWKSPATLANSLSSYHANGLLSLAKQRLSFVQEGDAASIESLQSFGFEVQTSQRNVGIGLAMARLIQQATSEFYLFLEDDWELIVDSVTAASHLMAAVRLIKEQGLDCVRLRHRRKPGFPLYSEVLKGREIEQKTHLLESIHWKDDPSVEFGEYIEKVVVGEHLFYTTSSAYANFTNNPCLYPTVFARRVILPVCHDSSWSLEPDMDKVWPLGRYAVAQGEGLFSHHRVGR